MPVTKDRKPRWDKGVGNAPVVRGLRLEPALADKLVKYARDAAAQRGEEVPDLAHEIRRLLREVLFGNAFDDQPSGPEKWPILARGLKADPTLVAAVHARCKTRFGAAGCVRHLLRRRLGATEAESVAQEQHFKEIAAEKHALMERQR